jgi:hypothetical protein
MWQRQLKNAYWNVTAPIKYNLLECDSADYTMHIKMWEQLLNTDHRIVTGTIKSNKAYWDVTTPIKCLLEYDSTD